MAILNQRVEVRVITVWDNEYRYFLAMKGPREREASTIHRLVRDMPGMLGSSKVTYATYSTFKWRLDQDIPEGRTYLCWVTPLWDGELTHKPSIPFPEPLLRR